MAESWTQAATLVVAYGGGETGAHEVGPAVRVLRVALREARLILLWPAQVGVPALVAAAVDERICYAEPQGSASGPATGRLATVASARMRAAALRSVPALRAAAPWGAIVFNEPGRSAAVPIYLCCLAGVERRAGFAAEFDGGMLTNALPPPGPHTPAAERHLLLLEALGLGRGLAAGLTRGSPVRSDGPPAFRPDARERS
ncbi:MAG TPA: hypothetical protein VFV10_00970 [Gammaproteobacteria bacterium]|nr:hypothetical protein [Gammaproteobacteria bacterium]